MDVAHGPVSAHGEAVALKFKNGVMVAAVFAAWIGLMALAVVNIAADANAGLANSLKLNPGIGPYSGKEAIWLATWFIAWPILHFALRNRDLNMRKWFGVFMVGMLTAVLLMWPPIFEAIADAIKGGCFRGIPVAARRRNFPLVARRAGLALACVIRCRQTPA